MNSLGGRLKLKLIENYNNNKEVDLSQLKKSDAEWFQNYMAQQKVSRLNFKSVVYWLSFQFKPYNAIFVLIFFSLVNSSVLSVIFNILYSLDQQLFHRKLIVIIQLYLKTQLLAL